MKSLNELAEKHRTDKKDSHHGYASIYEQYFKSLKNKKIRLLEIGVKTGASMRMFEEYFPNALITGIDIDKKCINHESDRIKIFIGDQSDRTFLEDVATKSGIFDIIIDDGGHTWRQQIISFKTLYQWLKSGGLYIIEDVHTSYLINPRYIKYQDNDISFINYIKRLIDRINYQKKYGPSNIEYIHFYKSLVIIKKRLQLKT